jgi:hypothetical protein
MVSPTAPALRLPPGARLTAYAYINETKRTFMKPDPRIDAMRLLAVALDTDNDAKADHGRLILNQIHNDGSMTDVLVALADIAAAVCRSRFGTAAHQRALSGIAQLLDKPEHKTVEQSPPSYGRTPRPHRDPPINRRNS